MSLQPLLPKYETNILQNLSEWSNFVELLRNEGVRSYLEIGSKHGGSMWRMGSRLKKGSRLVSVDLPHGDQSFKENLPNLQACIERLKKEGYDAHLIVADSTDPETVEKVRALGPFDACFIDANHTLPYVTKDWENYGPMCRIVAFHDIGFFRQGGQAPGPGKMPIHVPGFWKEIKNGYKFVEFKHDKQDNGIGVLWRS